MNAHRVVTQQEWITARQAFLAKERAFDRQRDALAAERRALPMVKVDTPYVFDAPRGRMTLRELFGPHAQLIVYHFMFDPDDDEGCPSCSLLGDHFDGMLPHLAARDTAFVAVSRAPLAKLDAFKARLGWSFPWVSSFGSEFNYDFGVIFREEDEAAGRVGYNFAPDSFPTSDAPGLSVFLREGDDIFHTYSTYARGLDLLIGAYNYLDLTPLGRHEDDLPFSMAWVRHHDRYEAAQVPRGIDGTRK